VSAGILIRKGSEEDHRESSLSKSWKWGLPAQYFHFATRDGDYVVDTERERSEFEALARIEPPPSPYKDYPDRPFTPLPPPSLPLSATFKDTLLARRTSRWFRDYTLTIQQLSSLLFYTWGKTASVEDDLIGPRIVRTSPSGGCRHPIEVYPLIRNVHGIPAGVYHYSVRRHGLELLKAKSAGRDFIRFCSGQRWVGKASALFVMTAIFPRTMWRYRFSRAYRVVQMDAGHLGQTFQLTAAALGLRSFVTAALQDTVIECELGVDGLTECVIYCLAAGHVRLDGSSGEV